MKKIANLTLMVVAAVTLTSCASSGEQASTSATAPKINRSVSFHNNNTDPYAGWVPKFNDTENWHDTVFYRCDNNGTATYRTYDTRGGLAVVANSPDCPAR